MVDQSLIKELKIPLSDPQCTKFTYNGEKTRILGKVRTTVQCIVNGAPAGNLYFKAHVIQDLYKLFETHSIAGGPLLDKLVGPPLQLFETKEDFEAFSTEPTSKEKKKKRKSKSTTATDDKSPARLKSPKSPSSCGSSMTPLASPAPRCQGRWTQHRSFHGWRQEFG